VTHSMHKIDEIAAMLGFCCCGVSGRRRWLWRPGDIPPGAAALEPHIYAAGAHFKRTSSMPGATCRRLASAAF